MKTLITTIFILLTLPGISQTLMLDCRRSTVTAQMHLYPQYERTVSAQDYREYQNDSTAISFRFIKENSLLAAWLCSEVSITMTESQANEFVTEKTACNCWVPAGTDIWLYQTNVFQNLVKVYRYSNPGSVTFVYKFE